MYFEMDFKSSSPSSSASSSPISIGWPSASSTSSSYSSRSNMSSSSRSQSMTCAYPSWTGFSNAAATPTSFLSDEDLFPEELLDGASPLLLEAPAPPRDIPLPSAMPMPLAPLYASEKKKSSSKSSSSSSRRRASNNKKRASNKLTPISESPEVSE